MATIETQIFSWSQWDEVTHDTLQFYNCKLKVPVADMPIGAEFDMVIFNMEDAKVSFYEHMDSETCRTFELHCSVGKEIK